MQIAYRDTRLLFILFFSFFCACCSVPQLKEDPVMAATDANYPSLEMRACGKTWHGDAVCALEKGQSLNSVAFSFQGYAIGSYRIYSKSCAIDQSATYKENEEIKVSIPGIAKESCVVTVTMAPAYPDEYNPGIKLYSFRGSLAIKVKDHEDWLGFTKKVTGNFKSSLELNIGGDADVKLVMDGCGKLYSKTVKNEGGVVTAPLHEAFQATEPKTCVLDAAVISPEFEDFLFDVMISYYDGKFTPLSIPAVVLQDNKLKVTALGVVSVISLDDKFEFETEAEFDFDPNQDHILRTLTVKGRSALGLWSKTQQKWEWLN
jgi:hypothetical protein